MSLLHGLLISLLFLVCMKQFIWALNISHLDKMKICQKRQFILNSLIGLFILALSFLFSNQVNASVVINDLPISSSAIVVPAYDNNAILICYNEAVWVQLDGSNMDYTGGGNYVKIYYKENPSEGSHSINKNSSQAQCFMASNLATSSFMASFDYASPAIDNYDTFNFNRNNITEGNVSIGILTASDSGSGESGTPAPTSATSTIINYVYSVNGTQKHMIAVAQENVGSYNNYNVHTERTMYPFFNNVEALFFEVEPAVEPVLNEAVYYGADPSYTAIDTAFDLPVYYDFCGDYHPESYDYGISLNNASGTVLYYGDPLLECHGYTYFNTNSGPDEKLEYGAYFNIFGSGDSTLSVDSNPFILIVYSPVPITGTYIIPDVNVNPFFIDTYDTVGTSTLPFHYNVCSDPSYEVGNKIYLYNRDTPGLTDVYYETTTCSSTASIDIPYTENLYLYVNSDLRLINASSTASVISAPFIIAFSPTYGDQSYLCVEKTIATSSLCVEETTSCAVQNGLAKAGFWLTNPSCESLTSLSSSYNVFKNSFPFNAYFDLVDSINTAIDTATSTATSTIGIPFIDQDATSSNKFIIMPVLSSSSVANAIGSTNANIFRTTIGYLIWILIAFIIYITIRKV